MEHINKHLQNVNNKQVSTSKNLDNGYLEQDKEILTAKNSATPFGLMDDTELTKATWIVLKKIGLIAGWDLPTNETDIVELTREFALMFREKFKNVNVPEVFYAFRNYPVENYGKNVNLHTFHAVMNEYLQVRRETSKFEESQSYKKIALPEPPKEEGKITDFDFMKLMYNKWTVERRYRDISDMCYEILDRMEKVSRETKDRAIQAVGASMSEEELDNGTKEDVIRLAKKLIVHEHFQKNTQKYS